MTEVPDSPLSMVEIARRSGVQRPAVSNWRRRHADFPEPVSGTDPEIFEAAEIAAWLDQRKIPKNALKPDEDPGATFGDRFRRTFGAGTAGQPGVGDHLASAVRDISAELMRIMDRLRSFADPLAYGDVVLALLYVRSRAPGDWERLVAQLEPPGSRVTAVLDDLLRAGHPEWPDDLLGGHPDAELKDETPLREIVELLDRALETPAAADLAPRLFRHLLRRLVTAEGHRGGEFYTPESVAELVVRLVEPSPGESVCDPCCGTGELLAMAGARVAGPSPALVRGEALGVRACRLANMYTAMSGVPATVGASAATGLREGLPGRTHHKVVVTNPPFNVVRWTDAVNRGDSRWRYGVPPGHNANFAWLQHVAAMLTDRGRAAVIMPESATFSDGRAERAIRAAMVEDGLIDCLVALPPGLFVMAPGVRTSIWLLRKGRAAEDGVLFIDAEALGGAPRRGEYTLPEGDIERIVRTYRDWLVRGTLPDQPGFARHETLADLRAGGYDLNARGRVGGQAEPFDEEQLMLDVRRLVTRLAELEERAAHADARLTWSLGEATPWKA